VTETLSKTIQPISVFRPADAPLTAVRGTPGHASSEVWTSPDGSKMIGSYRIMASGEKFDFHQKFHETTFILSGRMMVTLSDGQRFDLRAGDLVQVLPGTTCMIEVLETVHDFFVMTSPSGPVSLEP
jgi:uncharacterized cupin superfamily protein